MGVDQSSLKQSLENKGAWSSPSDKDFAYMKAQLDQVCSGQTASDVTGGAESSHDIQNYANAVYSSSKEKIIRDIAAAVFTALKVPGTNNIKAAPIGKIVDHLQKIIPNPKQGGKFNKAMNISANQRSVCHALAKAINNAYGSNMIPVDESSEAEICLKVSELMHSLLTGLHTEFVNVAGDVLRTVRNLETLKQFIDASYKKQKELVDKSGDARLREQAANVEDFYNRIKSELERQLAILGNFVNGSIGPTGNSLIGLLEDNKDFAGLVRDIKADIGTNAFGDKLANLLSGVSSVAHSAELIKKALDRLGMSVQEFKSAGNLSELRLKIYNHIMKKNPTSRELDKMMAAAELIYRNDYSHKAISDLLAKRGGTEGGSGDDDDAKSNDGDSFQGGAEGDLLRETTEDDTGLPMYWSKKSLGKKIKDKEKYRKLLFDDFRKLLKGHYQMVINSANDISHNIGNSIPVNEELDRFINVFTTLPKLDKINLHIALTGWPKDSTSRQEREEFMNKFKLVELALEPLTRGPQGELFRSLQTAVGAMIKTIDDFSDKMVRAVTEIHVDKPNEIRDALSSSASSFFGSFEGGARDDIYLEGSYPAFDKVKEEMRYFYNICNIKTNLSRTAEEMKEFGEGYEQILGEEAGWLINTIRKEFDDLIESADPEFTNKSANVTEAKDPESEAKLMNQLLKEMASNGADLSGFMPSGPTAADSKTFAKNTGKTLAMLLAYQRDAKVRMVEIAQAIDLYLRSFADGMAKSPDAVQSVVKMLDQVEIVAKWFTDRSGDNLAAMFECFPNGVSGCKPTFNSGAKAAASDGSFVTGTTGKGSNLPVTGEHYYEWVENAHKENDAQNYPGNPLIGLIVGDSKDADPKNKERLKKVQEFAMKSIKSMRALENILSAFASVGSKFGDLDLQSKTFMNPAQIFNGLCQYICASSFTNGFNPAAETSYAGVHCGGYQVANYDSKEIPTENTVALSTSKFRRQTAANATGSTERKWTQDIASQTNSSKPSGAPAKGRGILSGVSNHSDTETTSNAEQVTAAKLLKATSVAMASIPDDSRDKEYWSYHDMSNRKRLHIDLGGWVDRFYDTDLLFTMTVKSIVCKVFTVVDAYRLFNRPTTDRSTHDSLAPLRTILGGNEFNGGATFAKIMPEAVELYLRLPLLAEWYRDKFNFQRRRPATHGDWQLSLVPSIDGTWSGLIRMIFDQAEYVTEGNYTDHQVQKIVEEINNIYRNYKTKYPKATTRNIINSFVIEMNRVFGFVKQAEIDNYLENRRAQYNGDEKYSPDTDDFNEYDILGAESQYTRGPAPSDKFVSYAAKQVKRRERNLVHLQETILSIRREMDADFRKYTNDNTDKSYSFTETLRNYRKEIDTARDEKEQYGVVLRLLQGVNKYVNLSADKLIMVHESVTAPLAVLYNAYKVLSYYNSWQHGASIKNIEEFIQATPTKPATEKLLRSAYVTWLKSKYPYAAGHVIELFADRLIGTNLENLSFNSTGYINWPGWDLLDLGKSVYADNMLFDLLNMLLELSTNQNKLIQLSVSSTGVLNLDTSKFEGLCVDLLAQVKNNINKLRIEFTGESSTALFNKYENKDITGSTRWLEENLVEILIKNRDKCGLGPAHSEHMVKTFKALVKPRGTTSPFNSETGFVGTQDNVLRQLLYYKAVKSGTNLPQNSTSNDLSSFPFNISSVAFDPETLSAEQKMGLANIRNKQSTVDAKVIANVINEMPIVILDVIDKAKKRGVKNNIILVDAKELTANAANILRARGMSTMAEYIVFINAIFPNSLYKFDDAKSDVRNRIVTGAVDLELDDDNLVLKSQIGKDNLLTRYAYFITYRADAKETTYSEDELSIINRNLKSDERTMVSNIKLVSMALQIPEIIFTDNKEKLTKWNLLSYGTKSLMFRFNQLVKHYLYDNLEEATNRFYTPLIESFMSSAASYEVIQEKAFSDVFNRLLDQSNAANVIPNVANVTLGSPAENSVLFESNAITMRNIYNTVDLRMKKKRYVFENITDIPEFVRDRMKCNLPYFSKLFAIISDRADLLKRILNTTDLKECINSCSNAIADLGYIGTAGPDSMYDPKFKRDKTVELLDTRDHTTKQRFNYYNTMLSRLLEQANSIKKCSDSVYKELQDVTPYFMEVNKEFMLDYKQKHGVLPIMPASNALLPQLSFNYYTDVDAWQAKVAPGSGTLWQDNDLHNLLLPTKTNGGSVYKFNYAGRLLLARSDVEPHMDHIPGAKDIYNNYAVVANKTSMVSQNEYATTVKLMLQLTRYLNDGAVYSKLFDRNIEKSDALHMNNLYTAHNIFASMSNDYLNSKFLLVNLLDGTSSDITTHVANQLTSYTKVYTVTDVKDTDTAANINTRLFESAERKQFINAVAPLPWQFASLNYRTAVTRVLDLAENSNREVNKEEFANHINAVADFKTDARAKMRVYNILDLNIVPINVHAFMKEVPFVNILNYSYTFDRMMHDFVVPSYVKDKGNTLTADNLMIKPSDKVSSTRELMVKLLTYPHADLSNGTDRTFQYYDVLASLFNGNDNLRLGRPRYLSDQLWHKVLLNSSVDVAVGHKTSTVLTRSMMPIEANPTTFEATRKYLRYTTDDTLVTKYDKNFVDKSIASELGATAGLKYLKTTGGKQNWSVSANPLKPSDVVYCAELGRVRFDTKLVRNLTWMVQLQRIMRVVLTKHLAWIDTPVVKGLKIADTKITEYRDNDHFTNKDFEITEYNEL